MESNRSPCVSVYVLRQVSGSADVMTESLEGFRGIIGSEERFGGMKKAGRMDGGRCNGWNSLFTRQKGISQNTNVCTMLYKYK